MMDWADDQAWYLVAPSEPCQAKCRKPAWCGCQIDIADTLRAAERRGTERVINIGLAQCQQEIIHQEDEGSVMQEGAGYRAAGAMNVVDRARALLSEESEDAER